MSDGDAERKITLTNPFKLIRHHAGRVFQPGSYIFQKKSETIQPKSAPFRSRIDQESTSSTEPVKTTR